jgi:hypothetical protein
VTRVAVAWTTGTVGALVAAWLAIAALVASSGALTGLVPPAPQAMIIGLALAGWVATRWIPALRAWADGVDPRVLVLPHLFRALAGFSFLRLSAAGQLPAGFAVPAAWGDIAVAVIAALLLCAGAVRSRRHARAWIVWNVLGSIDIVLVVLNAARFWVASPASMSPMLRFPLALLPSFLVPIVLITHALLFARMMAAGCSAAG